MHQTREAEVKWNGPRLVVKFSHKGDFDDIAKQLKSRFPSCEALPPRSVREPVPYPLNGDVPAQQIPDGILEDRVKYKNRREYNCRNNTAYEVANWVGTVLGQGWRGTSRTGDDLEGSRCFVFEGQESKDERS